MKIYFAASITGGREGADRYSRIAETLSGIGEVLSIHVADPMMTDRGEINGVAVDVFERDVEWIRECDVLVAEVTTPSHGVGYEIGLAESLGKPVIALFWKGSGKQLSRMIFGNPAVKVVEYEDIEDACSRLSSELGLRHPLA